MPRRRTRIRLINLQPVLIVPPLMPLVRTEATMTLRQAAELRGALGRKRMSRISS
jgi:hypothetical protein